MIIYGKLIVLVNEQISDYVCAFIQVHVDNYQKCVCTQMAGRIPTNNRTFAYQKETKM